MPNLISLVIPNNVLDQIEVLCRNFPKKEWSGVLFYEIKGTIKRPDKMKITVKDILLMHRGTSVSTEFDYDGDVAEYIMAKYEQDESSINWKHGLIHSHNTMQVFFSGTDTTELMTNVTSHNLYLSLVVNNYMQMVAKVVVAGYLPAETIIYRDEEGRETSTKLVLEGEKLDRLHPYCMFDYNCNIIKKERKLTITSDFEARMVEIDRIATEKEKAKTQVKPATSFSSSNYGDWGNYAANKSNLAEILEADTFQTEKPKESETNYELLGDKFGAYILRLGSKKLKDDSVKEALDDLEVVNLNVESVTTTIVENYGKYYVDYFQGNIRNGTDSSKKFNKVMNATINAIKLREGLYPEYVMPIIKALRQLQNYYNKEKNGKQYQQ